MTPTLQIATTGFTKFCRDAARLARVSPVEMLRAQAGKMLQKAIQFTPKNRKEYIIPATKGKPLSVTDSESQLSKNDGTRGGTRGRQWMKMRDKKGRIRPFIAGGAGIPKPLTGATLARYQGLRGLFQSAGLDKEFAKRVRTRNLSSILSKKSWVEIADALGISIPAAANIRRALPPSGKMSSPSSGRQWTSSDGTVVELVNNLPTRMLQRLGAQILSSAIATRKRAMEIELQKGVFEDLKTLSKRYPGLIVSY